MKSTTRVFRSDFLNSRLDQVRSVIGTGSVIHITRLLGRPPHPLSRAVYRDNVQYLPRGLIPRDKRRPVLAPELVVLMNEDGSERGTALKAEVHGTDTPLHLAFSCYLLNASGEVLLTRRAVTKKTWPGVWTNTFCGHPAPQESIETALHRRADQELSARITSLYSALPDFRYRAVDASGLVENEICPVFVARLDGDFDPNVAEVAEWAWVSLADLAESMARTPFVFSPWMREQLPGLLVGGIFADDIFAGERT